MSLRMVGTGVVAAALLALLAPEAIPAASSNSRSGFEPHVVVATIDSGTNLFHPTWRRDQDRHPSSFILGYPKHAPALDLRFGGHFSQLADKNATELKRLRKGHPYWIPGTNIIGTWAQPEDSAPVYDARPGISSPSHSHGAQASSQIAGRGFGLAPDAYIVILDRISAPPGGAPPFLSSFVGSSRWEEATAEALRWAADQPWIDIIHTNSGHLVPLANESVPAATTSPPLRGYPGAVKYALSKGKIVVVPAGNTFVASTETSPHAGPPGVLAAGANDNCGYADFSNPDPHVVMDGYRTVSADPVGFGEAEFSGTSSSSPRVAGYVANLLLRLRERFDYPMGIRSGALIELSPVDRPKVGPLSDGRLTAVELHEVVRKTANPNPHPSKWDGEQGFLPPSAYVGCVPQPADLPFAFYPKMGYGEVSEHTLDAAFRVAIGVDSMPERPIEDFFYERSQEARRAFWGD